MKEKDMLKNMYEQTHRSSALDMDANEILSANLGRGARVKSRGFAGAVAALAVLAVAVGFGVYALGGSGDIETASPAASEPVATTTTSYQPDMDVMDEGEIPASTTTKPLITGETSDDSLSEEPATTTVSWTPDMKYAPEDLKPIAGEVNLTLDEDNAVVHFTRSISEDFPQADMKFWLIDEQVDMLKGIYEDGIASDLQLSEIKDKLNITGLDRITLVTFVDKILVYEGNKIEIVTKFDSLIEKVEGIVEMAASAKEAV